MGPKLSGGRDSMLAPCLDETKACNFHHAVLPSSMTQDGGGDRCGDRRRVREQRFEDGLRWIPRILTAVRRLVPRWLERC